MAENSREIALDTLLVLEQKKEYADRLLKKVLDKYTYLPVSERAFLKRLVEGVLERQLELDYIIDTYASLPVRKMKPFIRVLLRLSVYQILYMDGTPDSAACNEAVKLADKRGFRNLKGFTNGVLRSIAKNKNNISYPDKDKEPITYLSVKYSMPQWMIEDWIREYGREITVRLLEGLLCVHPVSIRFKTTLSDKVQEDYIRQMKEAGVGVTDSPYLPYARLLNGMEGAASLPGFREGMITIQDVSSMLCMEAAGITSSDFVMDCCAAPGGKSFLAAEKAHKVLARDVTEHKVQLLYENAGRMNPPNLLIEQWDAREFDENYREKADVLLLDVPCSGLGVIGKKSDIKYHVTKESLESINRLQKEIVKGCWQYVKPGGILLYSTCTIRSEENEEMLNWILQEFPFEPDSLMEYLPEEIKEKKLLLDGSAKRPASLQMLPGIMESDGFYIARLKRKK